MAGLTADLDAREDRLEMPREKKTAGLMLRASVQRSTGSSIC